MAKPLQNTPCETELLLKGYGLTTAQMYYRMPDYPNVLNTFVWQDYDRAPDHDRLLSFIDFWKAEIDGALHSVEFTHRTMLSSGEWRNVVGEFRYH
ncbi:usg protein [Cognatishimia sp. F0-27]|uniref:usg protein n=1 Tax=Cognatishimia sp. F0-27 TaxID=2816855 RepID=UPI001D0C2EB8|nr:usg protein [Cognatishimia sp. F0-27]MCC1491885.1 aspartate-semialdehyde dehydrogenase [Cognatishimia sp. F0-27]